MRVGFSMHFNKVDLNDIFRITDIDGRGPFMQEILRQSISGRDGSYRIDRRIPERLLNVEGRILAKSKEDLRDKINYRSEEHTSELQSRGHLVCRLLLEKKKKQRE